MSNKSIGPYLLGDLLGKGGFGSVYRAINGDTGETVAIKLIAKAGITKDKIASIKSEISLLRKLNHPNIVGYIDQRQTNDHLAIIIEYLENGSLAGLVKKYGKMKEILVAKYMQQLLTGLKYLHSEGVIHRDIKGANILTTKDGLVKLADFGISGHLSEMDSNDVVGTPYWMAPEMIELSPPTTASDIWSVGCTIIELIGGSPPYFDLPPMSALYRIVSDDHPPLPSESGTPISAPLRDFLLQCFHKDANLRATATKLLAHAWIKGVNRMSDVPMDPALLTDAAMAERSERSDRKRSSSSKHHSKRRKDKETDPALAGSSTSNSSSSSSSSSGTHRRKHRSHRHGGGDEDSAGGVASETAPFTANDVEQSKSKTPEGAITTTTPETAGTSSSTGLSLADRLRAKTAAAAPSTTTTATATTTTADEPDWDADEPSAAAATSTSTTPAKIEPTTKLALKLKPATVVADSSTDNWDEDEPVVPKAKLQLPSKTAAAATTTTAAATAAAATTATPKVKKSVTIHEENWDSPDPITAVSPVKSAAGATAGAAAVGGLSLADRLKAKMSNGSAAPGADEANWEEDNSTPRKGKVNIRAGHETNGTATKPSTSASGGNKLSKYQDDDDNFDDIGGQIALKLKNGKASVRAGVFARTTSLTSGIKPSASNAMSKYKESQDDEDYDDLVLEGKKDIFERAETEKKPTNLANKLQLKMAAAWDAAEADPFQDDEDEEAAFEDIVDVGSGKISEGEQAEMRIKELQLKLRPERSEAEIVEACRDLIEMFNEHASYRTKLISHYGVIPMMEMLELSNPVALHAVLQLVNKLIENNQSLQETLCLVGALPTIMKFAGARYSTEIRREASIFINEITHASPLTLQMFIACRGLPVLVKFLEHADEEFTLSLMCKQIVYSGLDGILQVFNIPESRTPKKDFCRLFAKDKVMYALSRVLANAANERATHPSADLDKQLKKVTDILLTLSQPTDTVVKQHMAEEMVLQRIIRALPLLPTISKVSMLKTMKNITADSNTRDNFQRVGAIPVLVDILGHSDIKTDKVALSALVHSLYNLTKLNKERQESVAVAGILPFLLDIFENSQLRSGLGQFVSSMVFDLAHAGKRTRQELWKNNAIAFYIKMLEARFEKSIALKSIAVWLTEETREVQVELIKPYNIEKLAGAINAENYSEVLPIFEQLLTASEKVGRALGSSKFVNYLVHAIETCPSSDPRAHTNLLKILVLIYKYHDNPKELIAEHDLYAVIMRVLNKDTKVIVRTMATNLLKTFDTNLKV